jgi:hydrogenase nickel incorporation protein HypA/HybF
VHEYGIAASLRRMVEAEARAVGARRVVRVEIRVGDAAGVERELLVTAWEQVRAGGLTDGAELRILAVPARWVCGLCRTPVAHDGPLRCDACGIGAVLEGGDDLFLDRLEIERDGDGPKSGPMA